MNNHDILKEGSNELGISITDHQVEQFIKYKEILVEWNQHMNLTGIVEDKQVMIKHFLDSLGCVTLPYIKENSTVIDVGTGAGFPGIPINIYYPKSSVTLLDSLNKRINFLKEVCNEVGLDEVCFQHGRAEDFGKDIDFREKYDIAVARAVAQLNVLCEYCLPFVKVGGYFICQKGPKIEEELQNAQKSIEILGGKIIEKKDIKLPYSDETHSIVVIQKIKETPEKYPRKAGKPTKTPLT